MKIFGKKEKNQKNNNVTQVEDSSPVYQLPYFMEDNSKKSKKTADKKPAVEDAAPITQHEEAVVKETPKKAVAKSTKTTAPTKPKTKDDKPTETAKKSAKSSTNSKKDVEAPVVKVADSDVVKAPKKPAEPKKATKDTPSTKNVEKADKPKKATAVAKNTEKPSEKKKASPSVEASEKAPTEKTSTPKKKKSTETKEKEIAAVAQPAEAEVTEKPSVIEGATTSAEASTVPEQKSVRTGKFEIKKTKDGRFVFNLYASNSVIVATSQIYSSSTSAINGIKSVIANAASSPVEDQTLKNATALPYPKWEIYKDKSEQYRFRLCASNGSCVCHSQGYTSKTNCKKGIESIIKFAANAEISKTYLDKKTK